MFKDKNTNPPYAPETVGNKMSVKLPTCAPDDTRDDIMRIISDGSWDSIRNIYVVDGQKKLLGYIDLAAARHTEQSTAREMMKTSVTSLNPGADQEMAVFLAVKDNMAALPVVEKDGRFLGAVTARSVVNIMHEEHLEDALLTAGIRDSGSDIIKLVSARTGILFKRRAPWLVAGLGIGMSLGFISSLFEETLEQSIALAFFIPVVAYIADSVGTQSSTIAIRALATMKIKYTRYLVKELFVGLMLGLLLGFLGALGALLISGDFAIAAVVGLALFAASVFAACLASVIPLIFTKLGKDPALGSGPIATAIQDVVSVIIYLLIAAAVLL